MKTTTDDGRRLKETPEASGSSDKSKIPQWKRFLHVVDGQEQMVPAHTAAQLILQTTVLRHMRSFPESGYCYIYDMNRGYYIAYTEAQLRIMVVQTLNDLGLSYYLSHQYIVKVGANLSVFTGQLSDAKPNRSLVAFQNGVLDLQTKELHGHDPKHWVVSKLPYAYDARAKPAGSSTSTISARATRTEWRRSEPGSGA